MLLLHQCARWLTTTSNVVIPILLQSRLPFMEHKLKKGDKGQLLKRCCRRVKCFIGKVIIFIFSYRHVYCDPFLFFFFFPSSTLENIFIADTDAGFNPTPSKVWVIVYEGVFWVPPLKFTFMIPWTYQCVSKLFLWVSVHLQNFLKNVFGWLVFSA